ncbi:hypothetical protein Vadar_006980 [Vaccinium darrowii]|uniref:Uncharacterized protein n=1 Tax=Vaccinium darrowii TaxID=229202 RepID=A0ACB7X838_9ERIC|nr:hypothetical protein Vadar_006980 [Vaccinium darrowii]
MDKGKKIDIDNWSSVNTGIFIQILVDEARKEQRTCSRNGQVFNELQWKEIHRAFLQPSALFAVTSDEELEMYSKGKPIKIEDSGSMGSGKRKSGNAGGSSSKKERLDKKQEAYDDDVQRLISNSPTTTDDDDLMDLDTYPPLDNNDDDDLIDPGTSHYSSDDDDLMDLQFLSMSDEDENRFPILKCMPNYPPACQPQIVTACCVVHNWIIIQRGRDEFFDGFNDDAEWEADGGHDNDDVDGVQANVEHMDMSAANLE